MLTVRSDKHKLRDAATELFGGQLVPPFECPARIDMILDRIRAVDLGPELEPRPFGLTPVQRIHSADYLEFLENCWTEWKAAGFKGEAIATAWPARRMQVRRPNDIDGKLGYYAIASETSITDGTWEAACASADVALTAQEEVSNGASAAFALCRPPGHHAAKDMFGGYCFINNAAVAADAFRQAGASRVSVLDIDFHHGNGTQDIFYDRGDVQFLSLHGRPEDAFPFFLGYADETGIGEGEGYNHNFPLPPGAPYSVWGESLATAVSRMRDYGPDAIVVSLGVDTFKDDPISFFKLESEDYLRCGEAIASLGKPTLFVMEGGYAVADVGINVVNVLQGFEVSWK